MANIAWMYRNICESPQTITETYGTTNSYYGTSKLNDNNLQTYWSANGIGTQISILFDMGSSVYVDSLICIHNLNETGTAYIKAGDTNPPTTATYGMPILGSTGTSINFLTSVANYRYWQLFADGTKLSEPIKIREIFIGKQDIFPINPEYTFRKALDSATILTESEKGQRKVYHKYTQFSWDLLYPSINEALYGTMLKIRNYCSGSYRPFYICFDKNNNSYETYFARFEKRSWKHEEIMDGIHNIEFSIREEL